MITAATSDTHSIKCYDVATGQYKGVLFVTNGQIIGQPTVGSDTISVTFSEQGHTWLGTWTHNLAFKSKIMIG